jgi:nucleoid-associated protein YgaU
MTDQTISLSPGDTLTVFVPAGAVLVQDPPAPETVPPAAADPAPALTVVADPAPETVASTTTLEEDLAAAAQAQAAADQAAAAQAAHSVGQVGFYTVQPGDTLDSIAAAIYGPDPVGTTLFDVNSAVIGSDPTALVPGTVLAIPVLTIIPASEPA